jgi:penicillin-binding protein 2
MESIARKTIKKIKIIGAAYGLLCLAIVGRLIYLQIYLNKDFFDRSQHNFLRTEKVSSRRGNILDCNGNLLATNRPITNIYWQGTGNRYLTKDQQEALTTATMLLAREIDPQLLNAVKYAERTAKETLLASDVSFEQLSQITETFAGNENINIQTQLKRCYPYGQLASHIIGYISTMNTDFAGKMGIEKMFEPDLRGQQGSLLKMINSVGTHLYSQEVCKALAGQDIATTLDLSLQQIAEQAIPDEYAGTLIIMDPHDGALRAIVSRPSFDPSIFLDPIPLDKWQLLQQRQPFLNRALCCYPPASPFKLVTLSAALEHNIITPDSVTYCRGFTRFRGRKYHCAQRLGHGALGIQEAVAQSCNILFFEIAKRLSIDILADYAHRFGLGEKTNIIFPEPAGLIPTTEWKKRTKGERWWPGENLSAVIGQSYLLVTPLQTARMIGSIFTGYLVTPRIIQAEAVVYQPLAIKAETRRFLKKTMKAVVTQGTAQRLNKLTDLKIYAKTGTAQTSSLEKQESGDPQFLEHAWLACCFKHKNEKPLIMVLLVENVGSSKEATKIAKKFLIAYRTHVRQQESIIQK